VPVASALIIVPRAPFPDDLYTRTVRVNTLDVDVRPWHVVEKLVRPLIESCGLSFAHVARRLGYESAEAGGVGRK